MRIEGNYNEDDKELIIKVNFEDSSEAYVFQKYFIEMVNKMAKDNDAQLIDVLGVLEDNEEMPQDMIELAKKVAVEANKKAGSQFKNNFLPG